MNVVSLKLNHGTLADLDPDRLSPADEAAVIDLAIRILEKRHRPGERLFSPEDTRRYLQLRLSGLRREVFGCLFLDTRHRILALRELFQGTLGGATVHPRIVVQEALAANAAAVVLYHNHPSGMIEPSEQDLTITRKLEDALALVEIRVLDHFIVGSEGSVSFAERGLL